MHMEFCKDEQECLKLRIMDVTAQMEKGICFEFFTTKYTKKHKGYK